MHKINYNWLFLNNAQGTPSIGIFVGDVQCWFLIFWHLFKPKISFSIPRLASTIAIYNLCVP